MDFWVLLWVIGKWLGLKVFELLGMWYGVFEDERGDVGGRDVGEDK